MTTDRKPLSKSRQKILDKLFEGMSDNHAELTTQLDDIYYAFREKIAAVLGPVIDRSVTRSDSTHIKTYDANAKMVDDAAHQYCLAVCDPESGRAALLVATSLPSEREATYNYLLKAGPDGNGYVIRSSSAQLKTIKFQPAPKSFDTWAQQFSNVKQNRER